jgi:hypothetical protein
VQFVTLHWAGFLFSDLCFARNSDIFNPNRMG